MTRDPKVTALADDLSEDLVAAVQDGLSQNWPEAQLRLTFRTLIDQALSEHQHIVLSNRDDYANDDY